MIADDFMAKRTLDLAGTASGKVTVGIKQPIPDGDDYKCEFQIVGLGYDKIQYGMGVDSVQALLLTLELIGTRLYTSEEGKRGQLTWLGSRNLGFPVPDNIADLVPEQ